jgi:hypothetical protein
MMVLPANDNGFIANAYGKGHNSRIFGFDGLCRFEIIRRHGVAAVIDVDRNVVSPMLSFKLLAQRCINCIGSFAGFGPLFFGRQFFPQNYCFRSASLRCLLRSKPPRRASDSNHAMTSTSNSRVTFFSACGHLRLVDVEVCAMAYLTGTPEFLKNFYLRLSFS